MSNLIRQLNNIDQRLQNLANKRENWNLKTNTKISRNELKKIHKMLTNIYNSAPANLQRNFGNYLKTRYTGTIEPMEKFLDILDIIRLQPPIIQDIISGAGISERKRFLRNKTQYQPYDHWHIALKTLKNKGKQLSINQEKNINTYLSFMLDKNKFGKIYVG